MPSDFTITRQVEFAETDMAGVMHFSNFFRYMEICEGAFFRSLGLSLVHPELSTAPIWPRVHAGCDYQAPLRYEDTVEIRLFVSKIEKRTVHYVFIFNKIQQGKPAQKVAHGEMSVVAATIDKLSGKMSSCDLPAEVTQNLQTASPQAWAY